MKAKDKLASLCRFQKSVENVSSIQEVLNVYSVLLTRLDNEENSTNKEIVGLLKANLFKFAHDNLDGISHTNMDNAIESVLQGEIQNVEIQSGDTIDDCWAKIFTFIHAKEHMKTVQHVSRRFLFISREFGYTFSPSKSLSIDPSQPLKLRYLLPLRRVEKIQFVDMSPQIELLLSCLDLISTKFIHLKKISFSNYHDWQFPSKDIRCASKQMSVATMDYITPNIVQFIKIHPSIRSVQVKNEADCNNPLLVELARLHNVQVCKHSFSGTDPCTC